MIVKGSTNHINETEFLAIKMHNINFVTIKLHKCYIFPQQN